MSFDQRMLPCSGTEFTTKAGAARRQTRDPSRDRIRNRDCCISLQADVCPRVEPIVRSSAAQT
jgi:hypothetical protein